MPRDPAARSGWLFAQPALPELTHNRGTETDPEARYHDGNSDGYWIEILSPSNMRF